MGLLETGRLLWLELVAKGLGWRCVLKVELTVFSAGLGAGHGRKGGARDLSSGGVLFTELDC